MKSFASYLLAFLSMAVAVVAQVPVQVGPANLDLKKVAPAVVSTPEFKTDIPDKRSEKMKWLEIEVEFDIKKVDPAQVVDELTFKYVALFNGKLYSGEVTHVNIPNGNNHFSVMYMSPRSIDRATGGKPMTGGMIDNIWVTVERQGQKLGAVQLKGKNPIPNLPLTPGLLVPKSETPFQVLWWDRYEAVKVPTR